MDILKGLFRKNKSTPLIEAIFKNNILLVEKLISSGVDVNQQNDGLATPLFVASALGYSEIAEILIKSGAYVNFNGNHGGMTALMNAAFNGKTNCVKLLLSYGADAALHDNEGFNALMHGVLSAKYVPDYITREQAYDLCDALIKVTPDINHRGCKETGHNRNALMYAAIHGHIDQYILLVNAGADFTLHDDLGNSVQELARTNMCFDLLDKMDSIHENALLQSGICGNRHDEDFEQLKF